MQLFYDAGYTNLAAEHDPEGWSYSYDGMIGSLDHIVANETGSDRVTGATDWSINAPESVMTQYARYRNNAVDIYEPGVFGSSDHNPIIVGLDAGFPDDGGGPGEPSEPGAPEGGDDSGDGSGAQEGTEGSDGAGGGTDPGQDDPLAATGGGTDPAQDDPLAATGGGPAAGTDGQIGLARTGLAAGPLAAGALLAMLAGLGALRMRVRT